MQIFFSYIKRLLLSPLFYLAIVMVSVICWFGMQEENARPGVIYAFDLMLDISSYRKLMMLFATIPFGTVYCRERNTKMANFILYRSSLSKHLSVYLVMQFVSSFLIESYCASGFFAYEAHCIAMMEMIIPEHLVHFSMKKTWGCTCFSERFIMPTALLCGRFPVWQCLPAF